MVSIDDPCIAGGDVFARLCNNLCVGTTLFLCTKLAFNTALVAYAVRRVGKSRLVSSAKSTHKQAVFARPAVWRSDCPAALDKVVRRFSK